MTDRLRVVHIITTLTTGGAERQLELLLSRTTSQAAVIALYRGGPVAESIRAGGHSVQVLGMHGWRRPLAWLRLARQLRRYRPDVVHVHLLAAQLWGIPAARLARVPVIVSTEHSLMDDTVEGRPRSGSLRRLYRILERLTHHTIAVSTRTAQRLADWQVAPQRVTVVDNGIDFAALAYSETDRQAVREEFSIPGSAIVIGAVGRLDPVKRMDEVIRAAAPRLRAGGHALLIAGTGDEQAGLQRLAEGLSVTDSVYWAGARADVPRLLSAMDVMVSASRDETFGMAVIEALGNGLPVVFAECPALEDLSDLPAAAFPARGSLSRALDAALTGSVRRRPVPPELLKRYSVEQAAAGVDEVYRRLVRNHD
ncbi:glycosyltransferase [Kineosporia mesophila]|uniref:Glycosyltransferase n=1 Tax=Kineosporia mesophila TaxID=566012 RepID=A0ABP6Z3Z3_9ACTN|nr:glycosyltransferase [Kineosporia mesophila]MCD5352577.1 glycosyltransferase [Kineosporia mesophila]